MSQKEWTKTGGNASICESKGLLRTCERKRECLRMNAQIPSWLLPCVCHRQCIEERKWVRGIYRQNSQKAQFTTAWTVTVSMMTASTCCLPPPGMTQTADNNKWCRSSYEALQGLLHLNSCKIFKLMVGKLYLGELARLYLAQYARFQRPSRVRYFWGMTVDNSTKESTRRYLLLIWFRHPKAFKFPQRKYKWSRWRSNVDS